MNNKVKTIVMIVVVAVVVGIALYLIGLWQGRSQITVQKEQCQQQLKEREARLAVADNMVHFLKARTALYQTAIDLDQRNFGMANAHLREADDPLAKLNPAVLNIDQTTLETLRQEIAATNIQVATDLETQRVKIIQLEYRLDALIPKPAIPPVMPSFPTPSPLPPEAPKPADSENQQTE